jgi:nucleotide-binding universal stress UspA family protein
MTPQRRLNVLLADDGSQHAQAAVEWLKNIPLPPKSRILVFRAFHSGQIPWISEYESTLERTKTQLLTMGYRVETQLQMGHAAELIVQTGEARKPDLIALGAKGLRSTADILLGGVAQHVVEHASCPVLVLRAPYKGFCRILLVTDGSHSSQRAARYLARFHLPEDAEVHILHVLPPLRPPLMMEPYLGTWQTVYVAFPSVAEEDAVINEETAAGQALLARTSSLLERHGIRSTPVLERGDAATQILDYLRQNKIDLVVAGSRGLSQLKSLWMGSVSRKLVHYANCSVLIVKEPPKE